MSRSSPQTTQLLDDAAFAIEQHGENVKAFRVHAAVFAVSTIGIFLINLLVNLAAGTTGDLRAWWAVWVLGGWGLGIAIHGVVVHLARPDVDARTPVGTIDH